LEKSLIERTMQYIKDRTKGFDDYYFHCKRKKNKCKLKHVKQWFSLFITQHNKEMIS
jgi:putative transposase